MKKLEKEKELAVSCLVHDVMYRAGILDSNKRSYIGSDFGDSKYLISEEYTNDAKRIMDSVRNSSFTDLDSTFKKFDNVKVYVVNKRMKKVEDMYIETLTGEDLMLGLAMVCKNLEIYFDSTKYTPYEMCNFIKEDGFAYAIALYKGFSQDCYNDINFTPSKIALVRDKKGKVTLPVKSSLYTIICNINEVIEKYVTVNLVKKKGKHVINDSICTNELFIKSNNNYFCNNIYFDSLSVANAFITELKKLDEFKEKNFLVKELVVEENDTIFYKIGTRVKDALISKKRFDYVVDNYKINQERIKLQTERISRPIHKCTEEELQFMREYLSEC